MCLLKRVKQSCVAILRKRSTSGTWMFLTKSLPQTASYIGPSLQNRSEDWKHSNTRSKEVAESEGQVIGSNFLDERDPIRGVGPVTVDPLVQVRGIGRRLMEAVLERARGAVGVRLVQDSFNMLSVSLYASIGFEVKEPLLLMRGKPNGKLPSGIVVRLLKKMISANVRLYVEKCTDLIVSVKYAMRSKLYLRSLLSVKVGSLHMPWSFTGGR
jgi:GNAT superfamily N-acetyltransferase